MPEKLTFIRKIIATALPAMVTCAILPAAAPAQETQPDAQDDIFLPRNAGTVLEDGAFSLQVENDKFGDGHDRNYTNGVRLSYVWPSGEVPGVARWLRDTLPFIPDDSEIRVMGALGQNIFTPEDITIEALIPDDRPYAGWLYGDIGMSLVHKDHQDQLVLSLGVVGPASLAEETQIWWHGVINSDRPQGWDNQLRNEPAILLFYEREWLQALNLELPGDFQIDASPRLGVALGNVFDYLAAGAMLRLGPNLPADFGPPRIRPSLPGSAIFDARGGFGWYLFSGAEVRFVARNIFLDGNTFRDSHSVDKKNAVIDAQAGLAVNFGRKFPVRVSYALIFRSKEFEQQTEANLIGSITLSVAF